MSDKIYMSGWINPLQFIKVDASKHLQEGPVTSEDVLRFLCDRTVSCDCENLVNRYREINGDKLPLLAIVPDEPHILEKLVWPLKHAKASYMLGNYLGTISLCGMVAEMVTILAFDISRVAINEREMGTEEQCAVFGSSFEKLGQDRRTRVLRAYNLIDEETGKALDQIRIKRKQYLHFWSQDYGSLASDAVAVYEACVSAVAKVMGLKIDNGAIRLSPALDRYLDAKGVYHAQFDASRQPLGITPSNPEKPQ